MEAQVGEKAQNLTDEVVRLNEIAGQLKQRLLDRFVRTKDEQATSGEAVEPNPIDYLIKKTVDTQRLITGCLELLEIEVIRKIEGGK